MMSSTDRARRVAAERISYRRLVVRLAVHNPMVERGGRFMGAPDPRCFFCNARGITRHSTVFSVTHARDCAWMCGMGALGRSVGYHEFQKT